MRTKELELVEARITILHQLSLAIRQASNRTSLTKVPKLHHHDSDNYIIRELRMNGFESKISIDGVCFDVGAEFEEFVRKVLTSRWLRAHSSNGNDLDEEQKKYQQTLLERCVATVSTRRRQLAYFRAHQGRLERSQHDSLLPRPQHRPDGKPVQQDGIAQPKGENILPNVPKDTDLSRPFMFSYEPSNATHEETVVSEFVVGNFKPPPASSAPSSSASTTADGGFGGGGPFEVPPPPKLDENEKEKTCPYCYLVLPAKTFSTQKRAKRWEKHLLEDLQPYICLFANCTMHRKTYSSFKAWQAHLSQPHYQSWHCSLHPKDGSSDAADGEPLNFDTHLQFENHLKIFHPDVDASSADDTFRHGQQLAVLPQWCFVCFEVISQPAILLRHMANHFNSMSLLALPWRDDIIEEEAMQVASDKVVSSGATNDNDNALATELISVGFGNWEETDEAVSETARKPKMQQFASLVSAVNEGFIANQNRAQSVEAWTQNQGDDVERQRRAQRKERLALCFARAVARLRLGGNRQQERRSRVQDRRVEAVEPRSPQAESGGTADGKTLASTSSDRAWNEAEENWDGTENKWFDFQTENALTSDNLLVSMRGKASCSDSGSKMATASPSTEMIVEEQSQHVLPSSQKRTQIAKSAEDAGEVRMMRACYLCKMKKISVGVLPAPQLPLC